MTFGDEGKSFKKQFKVFAGAERADSQKVVSGQVHFLRFNLVHFGGNSGRSDEHGFFVSLREKVGEVFGGVLGHTHNEATLMNGAAEGESFYKGGDFGVSLRVEESDEVVHHNGNLLAGGCEGGINETGGRKKKIHRVVTQVAAQVKMPPDAFSTNYNLAHTVGVGKGGVGFLRKKINLQAFGGVFYNRLSDFQSVTSFSGSAFVRFADVDA